MNIIRLTLYSLITAIERDLREVIVLNLHSDPFKILSKEQFEKSYYRLSKEVMLPKEEVSIKDIVDYFDFNENLEIILQCKGIISGQIYNSIKAQHSILEKVIPIRNRIAHSRPVKFDDHIILFKVVEELISSDHENIWNNLQDTFTKLNRDPNYAMQFEIPNTYEQDEEVYNNLPLPDFDETGFVGRKQLVMAAKKTILGSFPIITLLGDGGVGKTAIALKIAYDIIEGPENPFDAIIWTSSKTSQLTPYEIVKIDNAITDSLGVINDINASFGGTNQTEDDALDNILEYLSEFKVLLILDNLETVLDERIKRFLGQIPHGSKILITSRIGLGAYEYPIKVPPMDDKDAVALLRRLATIRGVHSFDSIHDKKLNTYLQKMNYSPGYIKWFISALQVGRRPEEVLARPDLFLDFCMSNVYDFLSEMNKRVLRSLLCLNTELSHGELAYINELDYKSLQQNLQQLVSSNMIIMNSISHGSSFETKYSITEFARNYLTKKHPVRNEEYRQFKKMHNKLISENESVSKAILYSDKYSIYHIYIRSDSDKIIARYLLDAMNAAKAKNFDKASQNIDKAQELTPDFFEVYRCKGWIAAAQGYVSVADTAYQAALSLEPKYAPLLFFYASFVLKSLNNTQLSKEYFEKALLIDSSNPKTNIELARVNMFLGLYDEAQTILLSFMKNKKTSLSLFEQKLVTDIYIQINYRKAEDLFEKDNFLQAIETFKKAHGLFYDCPNNLRDEQMKKSFRKAEYCLNMALSRLEQFENYPPEQIEKLLSLIEDNNRIIYDGNKNNISISTTEEGIIYKLFRSKNYGFILSTSGDTVFFHKSNLIKVNDWYRLRQKRKVAYNIRYDHSGQSAATDMILT